MAPKHRRHVCKDNVDPEGIPERNIAFAQEKGLPPIPFPTSQAATPDRPRTPHS